MIVYSMIYLIKLIMYYKYYYFIYIVSQSVKKKLRRTPVLGQREYLYIEVSRALCQVEHTPPTIYLCGNSSSSYH
jgi:hypothetical protein